MSKSKRNLFAAAPVVESSSYEECVVRVLVRSDRAKDQHRSHHHPSSSRNSRSSSSVASINGGGSSEHTDDDDDETSVISPEYMDTGITEFTMPDGSKNSEGWKAKYRFPIKAISVKGTHRKSVMIEIVLGKKTQVRELVFDTMEESENFQTTITRAIAMEQERAVAKMKVAMGGESIRLDESITFLVEIVSGWNLPVADFSSSDPFVKCLMDGKEVHRTTFISKTLDPVWTISTGSLFLLTVDVKQLFRGEGLLFIVYDFDKVGANDRLGAVTVPPKMIYDATGERMEFKLGPPPGKTSEVTGYLAIRVRRASDHDKEFMEQLKNSNRKLQLPSMKKKEADHSHDFKGGKGNIKSLLTRRSRIAKFGENAGQREVRC